MIYCEGHATIWVPASNKLWCDLGFHTNYIFHWDMMCAVSTKIKEYCLRHSFWFICPRLHACHHWPIIGTKCLAASIHNWLSVQGIILDIDASYHLRLKHVYNTCTQHACKPCAITDHPCATEWIQDKSLGGDTLMLQNWKQDRKGHPRVVKEIDCAEITMLEW